eukprot:150200-Alexandrium_andersonii.AAC.1
MPLQGGHCPLEPSQEVPVARAGGGCSGSGGWKRQHCGGRRSELLAALLSIHWSPFRATGISMIRG